MDILRAYRDFLGKMNYPSQRSLFLTKWVERALHFGGIPNGAIISRKRGEKFLKHLAGSVEEWQVQQAAEAIKLYNYFISHKLQPRKGKLPTIDDDWPAIIEKFRQRLRLKRRSYRTEQAYLGWVVRFRKFVDKRVAQLKGTDLQDFLTYLAVERKVAPSTQNQALNAIVFFFRHVLEQDIEPYIDAVRAKEKRRLPVVLSKEEVHRVLSHLSGVYGLIGRLMYGGGLRLNEALRLRVKDIDLVQRIIIVRDGKGGKDRVTTLPSSIIPEIESQLEAARLLYEKDMENGVSGVKLPNALARKYPGAQKDWTWYWVFPSPKLSVDPVELHIRRHHLYPTGVQRAFKKALNEAGVQKNATVHSLRHSFATHLLEDGYDIRTVQELLGHKNVQTTMIYTHIAKKNILGVISPLDKA